MSSLFCFSVASLSFNWFIIFSPVMTLDSVIIFLLFGFCGFGTGGTKMLARNLGISPSVTRGCVDLQ